MSRRAAAADSPAAAAAQGGSAPAWRAIEAVCRMERARLIASLVRYVRDLAAAEDLAHEAMIAAMDEWPRTGVPDKPGGWLLTTARRRAIDQIRRTRMVARRHVEMHHQEAGLDEHPAARLERMIDDPTGDDLLNLMFVTCHPILNAQQRSTLTLRMVAGLEIAEIARAFLCTETAIAQRLVRAKRRLRSSRFSLDPPRGAALAGRLGSVLEVIYLIFSEGYAATGGDRLVRPPLTLEARRLGRILAGLAPDEPDVLGLVALMELHAAREATRLTSEGLAAPLSHQDRRRWNRDHIRLGLKALARARAGGRPLGRYGLQAAIAACHATAATFADTPWDRIARLYDELVVIWPSPIVELNRAVAHGMAYGPAVGLRRMSPLLGDDRLQRYGPLWAAQGDLLVRAGRADAAAAHFRRAATLASNDPERRFLMARARACDVGGPTNGGPTCP